MLNQRLKTAAILCLVFLTGLLAQQVWFVLFPPASDHPVVAAFLERYRVTGSIEMGMTILPGVVLSVRLLHRQTTGRGVWLASFCAFVFWRHYLSGLEIYFRPPLGDGSLPAAAASWWRLHSTRAWIHLPSIIFLLTVTLVLLAESSALRRKRVASASA